MSIRTRIDALNSRIDSRPAVLGRWITIETSDTEDRVQRTVTGSLTLFVPRAFGADPEAGLTTEQRALIGASDRLIIIRRALSTKASEDDEDADHE